MKLSPEQVRHVATLARLDLTDDEVESLAGELSAILGYVEQLGELDTKNVEPTSSVVAMQAPLREDRVTNTAGSEATLAGAPERHDRYFVVPRIIE